MSDGEASDDVIRKRMATAFVNEIAYMCENGGRGAFWRAVSALEDAMRWAGTRPVATAERDERTRDLEELASELELSKNANCRLQNALARMTDERDEQRRRADIADACGTKAVKELEKTRALVEELREQLAACEITAKTDAVVKSKKLLAFVSVLESELSEHKEAFIARHRVISNEVYKLRVEAESP